MEFYILFLLKCQEFLPQEKINFRTENHYNVMHILNNHMAKILTDDYINLSSNIYMQEDQLPKMPVIVSCVVH